MGSYRVCWCFTRKFGMADLKAPADVKEMFDKYLDRGAQYMTAEQLRRFLVEVQGETQATAADAERIVAEVLRRYHSIAKFTRKTLSLDDFFHFLFSVDLNPPFKPHQIHQKMTYPLSHYFIYTGHNSYLTGNQLTSVSSDRLIIKALKQGVRVIELDLWPNSAKEDINVRHGRTLTTSVELMTCLRAIRDHAFDSSNYPVILTLEDHLDSKLQAKAAQMITETMGDLLYCSKSDSLKELPSPEELKNKILITTKPPKECHKAEQAVANNGSSFQRNSSKDTDHESHGSPMPREIDVQESVCDQVHDKGVISFSQQMEPIAYKHLISIEQRLKCELKEAIMIDPDKLCRVSLSEKKIAKAAATNGQDLIRFTQKNILRIYPKGSRVDSSNYNPFIGWMHGAQMVAFNMQGYDKSLWQMHGMFRANGGCGYVKKPEFLMNDKQVFDPKAMLPIKTTLKVKVYMGQGWRMDFESFDKYSPPDFYAKVGIAGVATYQTRKNTRIKDDEWNPIWNQEFVFPLTVPELALLRVEIREHDKDSKDDFGGQAYLPVSELRPGIHAIPLYDKKRRDV